jgi:hypothetical protein
MIQIRPPGRGALTVQIRPLKEGAPIGSEVLRKCDESGPETRYLVLRPSSTLVRPQAKVNILRKLLCKWYL